MQSTLSRAHRRELKALTDLAQGDLAALWRQFDSATAARDGLMDVLPQLVAVYGASAASLAADYYDEFRDATGARGSFRAIAVEPVGASRTDVLARVAAGSLFRAKPDYEAALTIADGGMQRHIANAGRETVRLSSIQDPGAQGWMRVGFGECDWCKQYLDGEVHYVEGYDFNAHDHCLCIAEPVFG